MSLRLQWHETASGLLYEAAGAGGGGAWTLNLLIDHTYETEQAVDPHPVATLEQTQRMAQEWEAELW